MLKKQIFFFVSYNKDLFSLNNYMIILNETHFQSEKLNIHKKTQADNLNIWKGN